MNGKVPILFSIFLSEMVVSLVHFFLSQDLEGQFSHVCGLHTCIYTLTYALYAGTYFTNYLLNTIHTGNNHNYGTRRALI